MYNYFKNIFIALDQLLTTIVGGWPDETLSSFAWRMEQEKRPARIFRPIIDWFFRIFFMDHDHCYESYISEKEKKQLPPELR